MCTWKVSVRTCAALVTIDDGVISLCNFRHHTLDMLDDDDDDDRGDSMAVLPRRHPTEIEEGLSPNSTGPAIKNHLLLI